MNRKTFLSSLLALITAPFLGKSKENGIPLKGEPVSGLIEPEGYFNQDILNSRGKSIYERHNPLSLFKDEMSMRGELTVEEENHILIYRNDGDGTGYRLVNKIPANKWY